MKLNLYKLIPVILIIICIPAIWHLLYQGYFSVHDDMHPAWILEMYRAIQSGQNPPSWAPDLSYGYGYPLFHFIYPLPYYLGSLFYSFGINLIWSIKLIYIISILGSAFSMYAFIRFHLGVKASLLSTLLYIYTPYRAVNIYVRGALGESLSWVFIPLIFLSIDKIIKRLSLFNLAFSGLSIGGLLLTHNIAAYAIAPFAAGYGLFRVLNSDNKIKLLFRLIAITFIGLSVSAYFWIPALIDKKLMVENTIFNYQDHFPFIKQLAYSKWGYGASLWGPDDGFSFQIGVVNIAILLLSGFIFLFQFFKHKKINGLLLFFLISNFIVISLMNIRTIWIWQHVPLISYFQFPWRWLILTTYFTSILIAFCFSNLVKFNRKIQIIIFTLISSLILVINFSYFKPDKHVLITDETILNKYFTLNPLNPNSPISSQYETIQEEYLRLPRSVQTRPKEIMPERIISTNNLTQILWQQTSPSSYEISSVGPQTDLIAAVYDFPLWQVLIDHKSVNTYSYGEYGQLAFSVPEGQHSISVRIKPSNWRLIINIYSQVIISALILIILYEITLNPVKKQN